jgi:hypothetical protein
MDTQGHSIIPGQLEVALRNGRPASVTVVGKLWVVAKNSRDREIVVCHSTNEENKTSEKDFFESG